MKGTRTQLGGITLGLGSASDKRFHPWRGRWHDLHRAGDNPNAVQKIDEAPWFHSELCLFQNLVVFGPCCHFEIGSLRCCR